MAFVGRDGETYFSWVDYRSSLTERNNMAGPTSSQIAKNTQRFNEKIAELENTNSVLNAAQERYKKQEKSQDRRITILGQERQQAEAELNMVAAMLETVLSVLKKLVGSGTVKKLMAKLSKRGKKKC